MMTTRTSQASLPADWRSDRLKDVVAIRDEKVLIEDSTENYLELEDLEGGTGRILSRRDTLNVESAVTRFEKGDVLFGKLRPYLEKYCQPDFDGFCTGEILAFFPKRISGRFLFYCMGADWLIQRCNAFAYGAKMPRVNWPKQLALFEFLLPPLPEQKRIAAYLDASCAAIDRAVATKQQQLETLDALRKSIIQKAVTQGLNPEVKMKDSGVEWLGQVPSHWDVSRIKRHTSMLRGKFSHRPRNDPALYDGPFPFFQTGSISSAEKYITEYKQTLNEDGLAVSRMFPKGIVVMSIAANIGDVAITGFEGCFPDSIVGFIPDHQTNTDFLFYVLKSMKQVMLRSAILTTQLNLNYVRIGANRCAFPPKSEQELIAKFLDRKMKELRRVTSVLQSQIATLTAYRKSLIHECVTGQRRITDSDVAAARDNGHGVAESSPLPPSASPA